MSNLSMRANAAIGESWNASTGIEDVAEAQVRLFRSHIDSFYKTFIVIYFSHGQSFPNVC